MQQPPDAAGGKPVQPKPTGPSSGKHAGPENPVSPSLGPGRLQAPWRLQYLEGLSESEGKAPSAAPASPTASTAASGPVAGPSSGPASTGSFMRDYWLDPAADEQNHVIVRTAHGMVMLNAFPYANGHLLVALGDARPRLLDYEPAQRAEMWRLTDLATDLMEVALAPQGINIGVNQGRAAGAGVPVHLHVHLVPRWGGDVNFITAVAQVRVIPSSLDAMAVRYRGAWGRIKHRWGE